MTENKPITINGVDVSKCEFYNNVIGEDAYCNIDEEHLCTCISYDNCYYKQLKCEEQECEFWKKELDKTHLLMLKRQDELVKEILKNDQLKAENEELKKIIERLDVPKHEVIDMDIALENDKLKQTLTEIKEIAEGMHDLWINKTPYTDIDNLVVHLLECELNRIRYKFDDISEVE